MRLNIRELLGIAHYHANDITNDVHCILYIYLLIVVVIYYSTYAFVHTQQWVNDDKDKIDMWLVIHVTLTAIVVF